jgi:hypothetical protein
MFGRDHNGVACGDDHPQCAPPLGLGRSAPVPGTLIRIILAYDLYGPRRSSLDSFSPIKSGVCVMRNRVALTLVFALLLVRESEEVFDTVRCTCSGVTQLVTAQLRCK